MVQYDKVLQDTTNDIRQTLRLHLKVHIKLILLGCGLQPHISIMVCAGRWGFKLFKYLTNHLILKTYF